MFSSTDFIGALVIWIIGTLISLWILWGIIRSAVLSALRIHAKEQHPHQVEMIKYQSSLQSQQPN